MPKRNPRRTDKEWLDLIQECRSSGLSDKCWCQEHHIHTSNFYYQIRRLRQKACEIPEPVHSSFSGKQEVVPLSFEEPAVCPSSVQLKTDTIPDSVIKITYHSFQIEITNAADRETIFHTLSALQDLCQVICPVCLRSSLSPDVQICEKVSTGLWLSYAILMNSIRKVCDNLQITVIKVAILAFFDLFSTGFISPVRRLNRQISFEAFLRKTQSP